MTTTTPEATLPFLDIDPVLLSAIVKGVVEGLAMTDITPPPVGASRLVSTSRPIAVVVGMVGRCNGSLTLSFDERTMLFVASALMGEPQKEVTEENLDAITVSSEGRSLVDQVVDQQLNKVVVDISGVKTIDSSGVAVIVSLFKRLRAVGGGVT